MRKIEVIWNDADWTPDTDIRMLGLVKDALTEMLVMYWVPPDSVTLTADKPKPEPIDP